MESEKLALLTKLAEILSTSSETIVEAYSNWFFYNAFGWIFLGSTIIYMSIKAKIPAVSDDFVYAGLLILKYFAMFVGAVFIFTCIPDLFEPRGYAIHQLLSDITN